MIEKKTLERIRQLHDLILRRNLELSENGECSYRGRVNALHIDSFHGIATFHMENCWSFGVKGRREGETSLVYTADAAVYADGELKLRSPDSAFGIIRGLEPSRARPLLSVVGGTDHGD